MQASGPACLTAKDGLKRTVLHYAAAKVFPYVICYLIKNYLQGTSLCYFLFDQQGCNKGTFLFA
jgi:hypothetical protein